MMITEGRGVGCLERNWEVRGLNRAFTINRLEKNVIPLVEFSGIFFFGGGPNGHPWVLWFSFCRRSVISRNNGVQCPNLATGQKDGFTQFCNYYKVEAIPLFSPLGLSLGPKFGFFQAWLKGTQPQLINFFFAWLLQENPTIEISFYSGISDYLHPLKQ